MRKIIGCILCCLFLSVSAFAETELSAIDANNLLYDSEHVFDSIEDDSLTNTEQLDAVKANLSALESEIKKINPDIINQVAHYDNDVKKVRAYSNILAKYTFDTFKDAYINKIKKYAKDKNRELKVYRYTEDRDMDIRALDMSEQWEIEIYELDGTMQRTDCVSDPRGGGKLCYYPDDYEHYEIKYSKNIKTGSEDLEIMHDNHEKKLIYRHDLKLYNVGNKDDLKNILYQNTWFEDYTKEKNRRNQIIKDLANGMIIHACGGEMIPYCFMPPMDGVPAMRTKYYTTHTSAPNWDSAYIPEYIGRWYTEKHQDR